MDHVGVNLNQNTLVLSPPVPIHGGLICIVFHLYVTRKRVVHTFCVDRNGTWVNVKGHMGQGQPKGRDIGRWAHFNFKLLHYFGFLFYFFFIYGRSSHT